MRHPHRHRESPLQGPLPRYRVEMVRTARLYRILRVTGIREFEITYDATAVGFDLVTVDGRTAAISWSFFRTGMLAPRFRFELDGESPIAVVIQVADPVGSGGDLGGFRLLLDGEVVYCEGTLRDVEPDLPLPAAAPAKTGIGSLPIPGGEAT